MTGGTRRDDEQGGHAFGVHLDGAWVGQLAWRQSPRHATGWYLTIGSGPAERLDVDPAVQALAVDEEMSADAWHVNAEVAALLSTTSALDAAHAALEALDGVPRRPDGADRGGGVQILVTGIDLELLGRCVPELRVRAAGRASLLSGRLAPGALTRVVGRLRLLGARIDGVRRTPAPDR